MLNIFVFEVIFFIDNYEFKVMLAECCQVVCVVRRELITVLTSASATVTSLRVGLLLES